MSRYRSRLKLSARKITLLILFIQLLQLGTNAAASSKIDLTTEYAVASKPTATVSNRNIRIKHLTPPPPTAASKKSSRGAGHSAATAHSGSGGGTAASGSSSGSTVSHELVALSSKSYISAPTTTTTTAKTATTTTTVAPSPPVAKLAKRAGMPAELKQKKIIKENLANRTRETESRSKLQHEAPDHIPDSSGHIPYRVGRPHLSPPEYGIDTTGVGSGTSGSGSGYHTVPYEAEKWHGEYWEQDYNKNFGYNNTRVQHIEAECQDDYMKIRIGFNGTFNGLLYSAGYAYDPDCMYINGSGRDYYEFYIQLNRCGTLGKNALHDEKRKNPTNFMWNTVTVQYNPLIEEEYDEHFKVTCEYGYDFWKTVTFPFLDVEVATGNPVVFTLSPPECYMEIQNGYGIGGPRVTGPVRVGDPLTLIIYMRSKYDGFDIVVNDCYAHNGANKRIQLIDEYGCPVDDKLISRFRGSWSDSGVFETQVYAYMKTFRFTGSPALYIECDVRMCHGRCPSQPCHWRNLKAVTKRDISNASSNAAMSSSTLPPSSFTASPLISETEKPPASLSENVNLFQSLRVLQEGEAEGNDDVYTHARRLESGAHQTCLKTSTFSALTATFSVALCLLSGALMIACSRLKQRSKGSLYDTYITHKGQID